MDFDTTPDKQGRRWVSAFHVFDGKPEDAAKDKAVIEAYLGVSD